MAPTGSSLAVNLTTDFGDSGPTTNNSEFCPPYTTAVFETGDSSVPYNVNAALNVPLAITTTFANLLVLLAMRHITSIRLPSKLLLCSLVLTDLGVGLVVQPQFAVFLLMKAINPYSVNCFLVKSFYISGSLFSCVSLLTMTAISLDRYAALFFHLKYHQIVTTRRVCAVLTFIWLSSLFFASTLLWNKVLWDVLKIPYIIICFLVISMAYIKIYLGLRGQHGHQVQPQAHVQAQQQAGSTLNMAKYKRTASAMLWIYTLLIICYLPYMCVHLTANVALQHNVLMQCILEFSYTVVLLNSCLNPFVYCLRLPEIRIEVLIQLRKLSCQIPQQ